MAATRVKVRVIPRAARNEVAGMRGEAVVVRLQAPPVEGAANKALLQYLGERLGVRSSALRLVAGEKSRDKVVEVEGLDAGEVGRLLGGADGEK